MSATHGFTKRGGITLFSIWSCFYFSLPRDGWYYRVLSNKSSLDFIFFWRVNDRCCTSVVIATFVVHTMPRQLLCLNHSKWTYGPTSLQALVFNILYSPDYPIYCKDGIFTSFYLGLFDLGYQWYERCTPFSIIFFFNRSFLLWTYIVCIVFNLEENFLSS